MCRSKFSATNIYKYKMFLFFVCNHFWYCNVRRLKIPKKKKFASLNVDLTVNFRIQGKRLIFLAYWVTVAGGISIAVGSTIVDVTVESVTSCPSDSSLTVSSLIFFSSTARKKEKNSRIERKISRELLKQLKIRIKYLVYLNRFQDFYCFIG